MKAEDIKEIARTARLPKGAELFVASDGSKYVNADLAALKKHCKASNLSLFDATGKKVSLTEKKESEA